MIVPEEMHPANFHIKNDDPARNARKPPAGDLRRLSNCAAEARRLAAAGQVRRGYTALLRGFFLAQRAAEFQPWAHPLSMRWRDTLDAYCEEFDPQNEGVTSGSEHPIRAYLAGTRR